MLSIIIPSHNEPNAGWMAQEIKALFPGAEVIISNDAIGRGKGWAVREGLKKCKGNLIAYIDGDRDIEPRMILRLFPFIADYDAVIGSKRICHKHFSRRLLTLMSRIYIRLLFGIQADTQTGIKLFKRRVLDDWKTDGFLFDVEILSRIDNKRIVEVPVETTITSRMTWGAVWRTFVESLTLKLRLLFRQR